MDHTTPLLASQVPAQHREKVFAERYLANLQANMQRNPKDYGFPIEEAPKVVDRMVAALKKGSACHSQMLRKTAKELGIRQGLVQIKDYLNGN